MVVRRTRRLVRRRARGGGFMDALRSAHDWIKKNKIISTVSGALSGVPGIGGIASAINKGSSALGYGHRRRVRRRRVGGSLRAAAGGRRRVGRPRIVRRRVVRRRRVGGSLRSILSAAHGFVKKHQLISKGLSHFNHGKLSSVASSLGYGLRRRPARRYRGGANFFTTEQLAAPKF